MTDLDAPLAQPLDQAEREHRAFLARKARDLLIHLDALARQLTIHDQGNDAVQAVLREVGQDVAAMQEGGQDLAIVFADGHAFVNGVWVRTTKRAWEAAMALGGRLKTMDGRGVVLEAGIDASSLLKLSQALKPNRMGAPERGAEAVRGLPGLKLLPMPSAADRARSGQAGAQERALDIFQEGLLTLSESELAQLDLSFRRRQRGLIQNLVQMAEESPEELLALTAIRDPTLPARAHNLMVAIYAIALGRLLDLGRRDLLRLGVCAMSHNLGESLVDEDVFSIERALMPHERNHVEQHPLLGLRHLLSHYGWGGPTVERALVSAEHHLHVDGGAGYPFVATAEAHPFSRIVAVADVFDALCGDRPHRKAYPPDQAVKLVTRLSGQQLDGVMVRTLVRLVGRWPPGTLVELDTGEWGVVLGPGKGADPLQRPRVLLISDADGFEVQKPVVVDLGERHPRRRAWVRTVARARDPRQLGIKVSSWLYADRIEVEPYKLDKDEPASELLSGIETEGG